MWSVEPKFCIGGTGISRPPLKPCQAQNIPETPIWTVLTLALTPLPSLSSGDGSKTITPRLL